MITIDYMGREMEDIKKKYYVGNPFNLYMYNSTYTV